MGVQIKRNIAQGRSNIHEMRDLAHVGYSGSETLPGDDVINSRETLSLEVRKESF
jgi:hypothetical protein